MKQAIYFIYINVALFQVQQHYCCYIIIVTYIKSDQRHIKQCVWSDIGW